MQDNDVVPHRLNLFERIGVSIFPGTARGPRYREGYRRFFNSLSLHFRPRSVHPRTLGLTLTWGLGGMAVVLVGLLLIVFLHFLRVFFTGALHPPRQFNWLIGLAMFLTVLTANITGYLLPWDQLAFWAVTICTGMLEYVPGIGTGLQQLVRGGQDIGPTTLAIFYAVQTALIPAGLLILLPWH